MGEPVKVVDLARDLIALSGLREGEAIEIVYTGLRPGEKLFEERSTDEERADAIEAGETDGLRGAFSSLVPEYRHGSKPASLSERPAAENVPPAHASDIRFVGKVAQQA